MIVNPDNWFSEKWFSEKNVIANPDKFQAMILQKQDKHSQTNLLNIDNKITETTKSVKLLGITNDSELRFDEHISNLCNKTSLQLNLITSAIKLPCN